MASRERYAVLTGKLHHVYTALEQALDKSESPVVRLVWDTHGAQLRRADLIAADLEEVGAWPPAPPTFETTCYLICLRDAAQSDRLLGHAYFRYAGGLLAEAALLNKRYRVALGLSDSSPERLSFDHPGVLVPPAPSLREPLPSLVPLHASLDEAGVLAGSDDARAEIVEESLRASLCNHHLHQEGSAPWERSSAGATISLGLNLARGLRGVAFGYKPPPPPPAEAKQEGGADDANALHKEAEASMIKLAAQLQEARKPLTDAERRELLMTHRKPAPPSKTAIPRAPL